MRPAYTQTRFPEISIPPESRSPSQYSKSAAPPAALRANSPGQEIPAHNRHAKAKKSSAKSDKDSNSCWKAPRSKPQNSSAPQHAEFAPSQTHAQTGFPSTPPASKASRRPTPQFRQYKKAPTAQT